jgi:hypothetical protein
MEVIVHEYIDVHLYSTGSGTSFQNVKKPESVLILGEDGSPLIAPAS